MVTFVEGLRDITVFSPSRSLISQLTQWSEQHWMYALRLVSGRHRGNVLAALEGAVFCVIDATSLGAQTLPLLDEVVGRMGLLCTAVYSEASANNGALETVIRTTGALYWAGPLRPQVWESVLSILQSAPIPGPISKPGPLPAPWDMKWGMGNQNDHVA